MEVDVPGMPGPRELQEPPSKPSMLWRDAAEQQVQGKTQDLSRADPSCVLELQICEHSSETGRGANVLGQVGMRSRAETVVLAWPRATRLPPAAFPSTPFPGLIFDEAHSLHPPALCITGAAKGKAPFGNQINWCLYLNIHVAALAALFCGFSKREQQSSQSLLTFQLLWVTKA